MDSILSSHSLRSLSLVLISITLPIWTAALCIKKKSSSAPRKTQPGSKQAVKSGSNVGGTEKTKSSTAKSKQVGSESQLKKTPQQTANKKETEKAAEKKEEEDYEEVTNQHITI